MKKEIIMVHIGQAGVQIGESFWNLSNKQIPENPSLLDRNDIQVLYDENKNGYTSRAVFADMEATPIDHVRKTQKVHNLQNLLNGKEDSANNFARGHYTIGKEIIDLVLDRIRKESEKCSSLDGFFLTRSSNGGTGSGLGSLLAERLSVDFGKKAKFGLSVVQSPHLCPEITGIYNCMMEFHTVMEHYDVDLWVDNEALYNLAANYLENKSPDYYFINQIIAQSINSITQTLMQGTGSLHNGLIGLATHLVPYHRIKICLPSYLPLQNPMSAFSRVYTVGEVTKSAFNSLGLMHSSNFKKGMFVSSALLYSGDVPIDNISETMNEMNDLKYVDYVSNKYGWNLSKKQYALKDTESAISHRVPFDLTMIANNTCVSNFIEKQLKKHTKIYAKRAFVHWYVGEGMSENGFMTEGPEDAASLIKDYEEISASNEENNENA